MSVGDARHWQAMPEGGERVPLWVTAVTVVLLVGGFNSRGNARGRPAEGPNGARASTGHDRGRHATTPSEIPARGWKDIGLRVYRNISTHRVLAIAAGVTFYSILAIFPAIAALVSLYGLFADAGTIGAQLDQVAGVLPSGAIDVLREQMTRVASQGGGTLGLTFAIGLLAALWSSNAGMKALFDALNVVYGEEEKRGFFKLNAVSLAFTTGAILFLLVAMAAVVVLPVALNFVGLGGASDLLIRLVRWPLLLVAIILALAVLYRYGPSRDLPRWRWTTWGSAFAAVAWVIASILFSWYAANFGSYNETYGSLGAVIGFMIWIWISAIVILVGAELDAEMEHQTARDTTVGQPRPLGRRGAAVADTVGASQG
ncbi:YihY/virulence factor BrkB family protein [Chelatococcus sp. GCM10030263]|uniref:YihY/virulence factor BrkB family protein n=1 Tax=Chelatococcus sp. GCM10030263 TaxID=3273387 RepID=UPI003615EE61